MKIVVVHFQDIVSYPPVISLVDNLHKHGHKVTLVGMNIDYLPDRIIKVDGIKLININEFKKVSYFSSIKEKYILRKTAVSIITKEMEDAEILWTTTDFTVRWLGDLVLRYKHVMQLMELIKFYPMIPRLKWTYMWEFPIEKFAKAAWRVVVPEENRAYIQKVWWGLDRLPVVLPNKPYYTSYEFDNKDPNIAKIKKEKRKIILYSGVLGFDRDIEPFAKAVEYFGGEYALYILANIPMEYKARFEKLRKDYSCIEHLGYYKAPNHLSFFSYAHIGLLPYKPGNTSNVKTNISELNALYCAPNKIFEYAKFNLPMIGTDVLGLKIPFEKYGIGVCVDELNADKIINAIKKIEKNYANMSKNMKKFYESIDLDNIVENILYGK